MDKKTQYNDFANVAFSFVVGYAHQALRRESKAKQVAPDGAFQKTDATRRLETAVSVLHSLWDGWNGTF